MVDNNALNGTVEPSDAKTIVITNANEEKEVVLCDVCGHANPKNTAICKMCSNYLKGVK